MSVSSLSLIILGRKCWHFTLFSSNFNLFYRLFRGYKWEHQWPIRCLGFLPCWIVPIWWRSLLLWWRVLLGNMYNLESTYQLFAARISLVLQWYFRIQWNVSLWKAWRPLSWSQLPWNAYRVHRHGSGSCTLKVAKLWFIYDGSTVLYHTDYTENYKQTLILMFMNISAI